MNWCGNIAKRKEMHSIATREKCAIQTDIEFKSLIFINRTLIRIGDSHQNICVLYNNYLVFSSFFFFILFSLSFYENETIFVNDFGVATLLLLNKCISNDVCFGNNWKWLVIDCVVTKNYPKEQIFSCLQNKLHTNKKPNALSIF